MSVEVLPLGTKCNIGCTYCYQESTRHLPQNTVTYDKDALLAQLRQITGEPWTLFGGEPLLIPLPDLEAMLRVGFEVHGQTSIQTNGTLITPRHVELFAQYHTAVGISLDGPDELNDARWVSTLEATRKMTRRSHEAVDLLVAKARETGNLRLIPSFIVQLHALNVVGDRWPRLLDWFRHLDALGVQHAQYHLLDLDHEAAALYVPPALLTERLLDLWHVQQTEFTSLRFKELVEFVAAQRGQDVHTCVWHACDPWNTRAVEGLNGDGTPTQCGRAGSNDGVDWVPAEGHGEPSVSQSSGFRGNRYHERQLSLYVTPQEHGGCHDCRFWLVCQAHCPGSGLASPKDQEGDWRLRTEYCEVFKAMFGEAERRVLAIGETPVSLRADRGAIEARLWQLWANGREATLPNLLKERAGTLPRYYDATGHGDHYDSAEVR